MRRKTITVDLLHLSGERSLGDMKHAMEVQSFLLRRALPHADIPPLFSVREVRERSAQLSLETLLSMDRAIMRQRLQVRQILTQQVRNGDPPQTLERQRGKDPVRHGEYPGLSRRHPLGIAP